MGNQATRQPDNQARCASGPWRARGPAFTLIELLIVIVVIGVLAAVLFGVGHAVIGNQKANATENTMRLVTLAIDQFTEENSLRSVYDNPKLRNAGDVWVGRTFGPYPPYQLANAGQANTVAGFSEPFHALIGGVPVALRARLARDLSGYPPSVPVNIADWADVADGNANGDIRSLYCYLAAYSPGVLDQIPETSVKPLPDRSEPEFINPTGTGTGPNSTGRIDVFGIYDAWGVPLDYFLYVKLEYMVVPDGSATRWVVTDRVPVLRSRAASQDEIDKGVVDPRRAIYSEPFPHPAASVNRDTGALLVLKPPDARANGWARAVALSDDYKYVPKEE